MVERKFGEKLIIGCKTCGFKKILSSTENINLGNQRAGSFDESTIMRIITAITNSSLRNRDQALDSWGKFKEEHKHLSPNCTGYLEKLSN